MLEHAIDPSNAGSLESLSRQSSLGERPNAGAGPEDIKATQRLAQSCEIS